ncbi:hypothetical protein PCYB_002070 [Plasmodium cynomolgi strain B]|uniref:CYIR protein n=1 Tax=Plasmodium cynomolgi (strain B) TaxID=1120755 RepID=K6UNG2_PLACD|nr:hypothetical protein PCYB_002070 [Plasmodium cynomolgi strain B]GAB69458.1 hypothetical protein PCYB_002070 [Plasmodium cynomolgi strain B]
MNNVISNKEYCNYIDVSMKEYNLHQKNCEIENNSSICNEIIKYIIPHLKIRDDFIIKCDTEEASDTNTHNDQDLQHSPEQNPESVTDLLVPDSSNDGKSTRAIISASFAGTVGFLFLLYKVIEEILINIKIIECFFKMGTTLGFFNYSSYFSNVLFFFKYQFTPLRSMLDPVIRKTKKNLMNSVQGSNELKSQDNDFYPTDMDLNRYNIAYQSR